MAKALQDDLFSLRLVAARNRRVDLACTQVDATFDDEAIVQYYLLNLRPNPCELMTVGRNFHDVAYALAFDLSNLDFIPFSEAIVYLREIGEIGKLAVKYQVVRKTDRQTDGRTDGQRERDRQQPATQTPRLSPPAPSNSAHSAAAPRSQVGPGGEAAEDAQVAACVQGAGSGVLIVDDMIGLMALVAGILGLAALVHGGERFKVSSANKAKVSPEDGGKGGEGEEGAGQGLDKVGMDAAIRAGVESGVRAALARMEESRGGRPASSEPEKREGMS
eukprot:990916-Rhodomonas_salina.7